MYFALQSLIQVFQYFYKWCIINITWVGWIKSSFLNFQAIICCSMQYPTETQSIRLTCWKVVNHWFRQRGTSECQKREWLYSSSYSRYDSKCQFSETPPQIWSRRQSKSKKYSIQEYHDIGEKTPLHYSVEKNNYEITNLLLDSGANTTLGDKRGLTPLHYAARHGFK